MNYFYSKDYWKILLLLSCITLPVGFELCNIIEDVIDYHECKSSTYQTPWHSDSWIKQPYTEFKLWGMSNNIYWTKNYIRSQNWLVKDTYIGDKVYWTILERREVENK
jgi:hypothetical protein